MKYLSAILLLTICNVGQAQTTVLKTDTTLAIPQLSFDTNGELKITASATSSQSDFDFLVGKWKMHNRRLNKRLEDCKDWTEFDSSDENFKILGGKGDMDTYSTTEMPGQEGKLFEGVTLRLFNPKSRLWSLYWVASNVGVLDPPVVGSFEMGSDIFLQRILLRAKILSSCSVGMRGIKAARCGARPFLLIMVRPGSGIGIMCHRGLSNAGFPRNWLFDATPLSPLAPAATATELVLVRPKRYECRCAQRTHL